MSRRAAVLLAPVLSLAAPLSAQEVEFPDVPAMVVVQGRVIPADARRPAGLLFFLRAGERTDSAAIDAEGRFMLVAPLPEVDTVEVFTETADRGRRWYFPSWARIPTAAIGTELRFVLVPRAWVVENGTYAGRAMEINLVEAFRPAEDTAATSSFYFRYPYFEGRGARVSFRTRAWAEEAFPLPVAFRHDPDQRRITPRDSTAFWRAVERMHRELGRELFRPARLDDLAAETGEPPARMIVARLDASIGAFGMGGATVGPDFMLQSGEITFREPAALRDEQIVIHELMHALGFGHTCGWYSVMRTANCFRTGTLLLAPHDVAHLEVFFRVHALQREHRAPYGLVHAYRGDLVIARGQPAP